MVRNQASGVVRIRNAVLLVCATLGGTLLGDPHAFAAPPPEIATTETDSKVEKEETPRRIQVWWGTGAGFEQLVERFNASQNRIVVQAHKFDGYGAVRSELQKALQAQRPPAAAIVEVRQVLPLSVDKKILPLGDFIAADSTFQFEDLIPGTLVNLRFGDQLFALPMNRSTPILYYNKDRFAAVGLDSDKPPETWEELREMSRKLTSEEAGQYGFLATNYPWIFESAILGSGGELLAMPPKVADSTSPAPASDGAPGAATDPKAAFAKRGRILLQLWGDMVHQDKTARNAARDQWYAEFSEGRAAMVLESTAMVQFVTTNATFRVGTAFLPSLAGVPHAVTTGGGAAVIPAGIPPEDQRAAWSFLTWCINTRQTAEWSRATGYIPVRESARILLKSEGFYRDHPEFETAVKQLKFAREAPLVPKWHESWGILDGALVSVLRDNESAFKALSIAETKVNAKLQGSPLPKP